ncbi:MAG: M36 family metallopeptidase [Rhizobacter sp.]|nr:M36 family metallopeptidase [Ferruginibacter sp.]
MKKIYLLLLLLVPVSGIFAQEISKTAALDLVKKNSSTLALSPADIENSIVSNAYKNKTAGTEMVYLQQSYKELPVFNQVQSLAFKNGLLVSNSGYRIKSIELKAGNIPASPSVAAENAVLTALQSKNIKIPASFSVISNENNRKIVYEKTAGSTTENISAELMWVPLNDGASIQLAWQVFIAPYKTSDYWMIRVNAHSNQVINENNLTVYCNFKHTNNHLHDEGCDFKANAAKSYAAKKAKLESDPEIVNGASYRVIPFPAESPQHAGGAHALRTDPWTAAPGNATSLKWHSNGTTDYAYTRGNNVWAYQGRKLQGTSADTIAKSTASTTPSDPLSFDFTPNFSQSALLNSPARNKDFNVTNLFYWNNVIHDVLYQYGFDEVSGNFQANNQGRGGLGNDAVKAEAQDESGSDNANFGTQTDGGTGRMQMYLWNKANRPAFTIVNTPVSIAGNITSVESNFTLASGFGANNILAMVGPVTADVVYYTDDVVATHDGCVPPIAGSVTGKIALINRGNCDFLVKVQNAKTAGAVGVIVINNVTGAPTIMGGANALATLNIPAVMVSQADGAILVAQVSNGLNITLAPDMIDGDIDNGIVVHEFGHGISNRLTGGPAQANCLNNAEQMGEGWSDYYALMLTQDWAGSNINTGFTTPRGIGTYAISQPVTGGGIRTQRYSTDFTVNNLVFATTISAQQHTRGELWCATLWDMTWNIIQQTNSITPSIYNATGTGGNVIALKLVTEGMKLQPCSPGFIDGRDAILQADQILYNGQYSCAIKEAFRRRGMGPLASQGSSSSVTDQVPDFTTPVSMELTQNAATIPEGQNITYTHKVTACGPVSNYTIRDTLPTNVTYVSGGTYDAGTRVVSIPVNIAAPGGTQNLSFTVLVNAGSYYAPVTNLNEPIITAAIPATLTATSTTATVWAGTTTQSHSAPASLLSPNVTVPSDQVLRTTNPIVLGPNQSALSFWHWYNTENGYDGGVVEISTDAGTTWNDLDTKMILGYYNGKIAGDAGTPITNRKAYTGNSNGFIKTDINLSSYAGQPALLRWRFNSDNGTALTGWFVDDILVKNEAVVNMRSNLFNSANILVTSRDTVSLIQPANVCTAVALTTQPANITVCSGAPLTISVTASGTTPAYQWEVSTDGGNTWANVPAATTATLNLGNATPAMNGNRYRVVISNTCPSTVTSAVSIVTVTTPSAITSQPTTAAVCEGTNASFSVTASGTALTYQWQVSTNSGSTWTDITGATAATLNLTAVTAAMNNNQYRVIVATCATGGLTSNPVTLTVNPLAVIGTQPGNVAACLNSNATFSVAATGGTIIYQWQLSTDGGNTWNNVAGAISASIIVNNVTLAMTNNRYRVIINNSCTSNLTSNAAILTVTDAAGITNNPVNSAVCLNGNASFSVLASGTTLTYQWQVSTDGGNTWANIAGATSATLNLAGVTAAMNNNRYRAVVFSCGPTGTNSAAATLTVTIPASFTSQPASVTVCPAGTATFSATSNGSNLTYQWQVSNNGGTSYTNIAGATAATITISNVTVAMNNNRYRLLINDGNCTVNVASDGAILSINQPVSITTQPVNTIGCVTQSTSFTVVAAGLTITYQWQLSTNGGGSFVNLSNGGSYAGVNTNTLTISNLDLNMTGYVYRVVMDAAPCGSVTSANAILTVNSLPAAVLVAAEYANILPYTPSGLYVTVSPAGNYTYQWIKDNAVLPNVTGSSYPLNPDRLGTYRVNVMSANACTVTTNSVTIGDSVSNQLFVYSNPSQGQFQVRFYNASTTAAVRTLVVYDSKGSRVYSASYTVSGPYDMMAVNMQAASVGTYVIFLLDAAGNKLATGRLVIQR